MEIELEMKEKIRETLKNKPNAFPTVLARELGVSELEVVRELEGEDAFCEFPPECFDTVMQTVPNWGIITFLVSNDSVISETKAVLPKGNYGGNYFNLHADSPIGGHIKKEHLARIAFVKRQAMGMELYSIIFFDASGKAMFKILLSRDDKKQVLTEQKEAFLKLKEELKNL